MNSHFHQQQLFAKETNKATEIELLMLTALPLVLLLVFWQNVQFGQYWVECAVVVTKQTSFSDSKKIVHDIVSMEYYCERGGSEQDTTQVML